MKSKVTWIVVADGNVARFYNSWNKRNELIETVPFEMRLLNDLTRSYKTDKHGKSVDTDAQRENKRRFVNRIAEFLREQSLAGQFRRVILIAPPPTLGDLRTSLDNETLSLVVGEIPNDFTRLEADKVHARLLEKEWF